MIYLLYKDKIVIGGDVPVEMRNWRISSNDLKVNTKANIDTLN